MYHKDSGADYKSNLQCAFHTIQNQAKLNLTLENFSSFPMVKDTQSMSKYAKELAKSFFYLNGSCYYLSPLTMKKSWLDSKKFCESIGSNAYSSLYSYENNTKEFDYLLRMLEHYYNSSNAKVISFYIGLTLNDKSMFNF